MKPLPPRIQNNAFSATSAESGYVEWWLQNKNLYESTHVDVAGLTVWVDRGVFSPSPDLTYSSLHLIENLPDLKGKRVLDMGAGCGIIGIYALSQGAAHLTAVEPNRHSIKNLETNFLSYGLLDHVNIIEGCLFNKITETYDIITANLPIVDAAWPNLESSPQNLHISFLRQLPNFLADGGHCFLSFASFGDARGFAKLIANTPLNSKVIAAQKFGINWYTIDLFH